MIRIFLISIFSFLFFANAHAENFEVTVRHYEKHDTVFRGYSKNSFEDAELQALKECKEFIEGFELRTDGCLVNSRQSHTALQTLTGKEFEEIVWGPNLIKYLDKLKQEKQEEEIAKKKILAKKEKLKKEKERKLLLIKLDKKFGSDCEYGIFNPKGFKKESKDYENCLIAKQKEAEILKMTEAEKIKKEKQLLANMSPEERSSYKCENTYGFRKGTSKFKECLFKMYQAEIELEKLKIQNENQIQKLALEREKLKASQAQTEAANAQALAAREQAEAAKRNAEANERRANTADYERRQKQMQRGIRSLSDNCILKGTC